jgi:hypothetical protein
MVPSDPPTEGQGAPSERSSGGLYPRTELRLIGRALRWGLSDELRQDAIERCAAVLRHPQATRREIIAAVRVLGYLDEIDRRRDRDEAEGQQQRDKNAGDFISSLLATPEGRAALLARTHAAYDALEQQRQKSAEDAGQPG